MTERLARASARRPWLMISAWVVAIVLAFGVIGIFLEDALSSEARVTGNPESAQAEQLLAERFPAAEVAAQRDVTEVVVVRGSSPDRAKTIADELRAAGASHVVTPSEDDRLLSENGDAFALLIGLGEPPEDKVDAVVAVVERLDAQPAVVAGISGEWTLDADFQQLSQDDLRTGELYFGIPAALVVLLLVFGAVVAGIVPLVFALVSIFVALALTALIGQAFELSVFVVNMLTGMGLALGIDYTLFILSRYREERAHGREKPDAIAAAGATASRAVLFSGLAFVLAMTGMLLVPSSIMRRLAAGAILVGIVSVIAALTLLPAVLSLVGDRVNALRIPYFGRGVGTQAVESRFWGGLVGRVHPPRPLRVEARIPTPEPGVPRPVDRPRADCRGRECVLTGRAARNRPPRGSARRTALVRRADRRDERDGQHHADHRADRRGRRLRAGDRGGARLANGGHPGSLRRRGSRGADRRRHRDGARVPRRHGRVAAARLRLRPRPQLHSAHDRLPLDHRARDRHRHEPALGRGDLRPTRARFPEGQGERAPRLPAGRPHRGVGAPVPLLRSLRPLDGLPGVPALPDSRKVLSDE